MMKRDFTTHFALKHMHKDLRLMTELASEINLSVPITAAIQALFATSETAGKGDADYSAILAQLEHASPQ